MADYNSSKNQSIKGKFTGREVYMCFSYEMGNILEVTCKYPLQDCLPNYDDVENIYTEVCPHCREEVCVDEMEYAENDHFSEMYECPSCHDLFDYSDSETQEVHEWWIVSEFLHEKLKEKGCPVLEWGNNYYWGRCTTGQAILLDRVISEICSDMGILEGQQCEWGV